MAFGKIEIGQWFFTVSPSFAVESHCCEHVFDLHRVAIPTNRIITSGGSAWFECEVFETLERAQESARVGLACLRELLDAAQPPTTCGHVDPYELVDRNG
ncbi:hypothetical protein [Tuwongella immobilis]|uniref:Uncharacterized protein n=1 Tax=Tuwongella immobilis TaxID=692036 RepID=A0A6C2YQM9_9BACT|nr:hypothetical protein [Tuwongella immobilis]VIP03948.1 unnamed protein product [Tuwongella immobilis]VTS05263.1 unnamed protein product [Tuwongella immobilis]